MCMCWVFASVQGCVQVCTVVRGCAWVCEGMRGHVWACELVFTGVREFSKFLPENIVLTSADFDMYPIRFFSKIFPNTYIW